MDINSTAPSFREVLLARNIVADSISNNGLAGLTYGIGNFVSIGHNTPNVHPSEDLELIGELYRDLLIVNNKHQGSLDDNRRISIVTLPNAESGEDPYNHSYASLIEDSLLRKDLNIINNKYKNVLGEERIIDIKLFQSLTPSDVEYGIGSQKLGIDESSNKYRTSNVIKSKYLDFDSQILRDIVTTPVVTDKNLPNYMTRMAGIVGNGNGSVTSAASSIIGSILGGTQPSYSVGTPNPVFEIGGALSNSNIDDDTPLGIYAAQGLNNAIGYNIGANLYEETLGNINTNPLSLLMGNSIIVPNYSITVAKGTFGGLLDYSEKILGFQTPVSLMSQSSSIFQSENPVPNIQRANSLIANTGKGQVLSLFANMRASLLSTNNIKSGYAPSFVDEREPNGGLNGNIYAFGDGKGGVLDLLHGDDNNPISQSNYNDGLAAISGFKDLSNTQSTNIDGGSDLVGFTWSDPKLGVFTNTDFNKKSILYKTGYLFSKTNKMINLTTGKFAQVKQGETNTTVDSAAGSVISKGSAVRKFNGREPETDPAKMFSRTWTTFDRYDRVENLQKSGGLNPRAGVNDHYVGNSVLDDNGFVKIAPYGIQGEDEILSNPNLRNYMFSIENLAWAGKVASTKLIQSEIGPGDTLTGKKGRIMWFPPYEMSFNDNTNVNWETTDFIGRGEPIYTYNNTTRIGTLQFKIIIDHPSYMNSLKGESDALIDSFFAGEFEVDDRVRSKLSNDEINSLEVKRNNAIQEVNDTPTSIPDDFTLFFPYNDPLLTDVMDEGYENGLGFDSATNPTGFGNGIYAGSYNDIDGITRNDTTNYGLNKPANLDVLEASAAVFRECIGCKVTITSYGVSGENKNARRDRAFYIQDYIKNEWGLSNDPVKNKRYKVVDGGETPVVLVVPNPPSVVPIILPTDSKNVKDQIKVVVTFQWDAALAEEVNPNKKIAPTPYEPNNLLNQGIKSRFYNEIGFFKKLQQEDKVVYDSISEKIAFFHPAFHSITPEGFNSRLTFLQQCTRQGPTLNDSFRSPDNLAFGRPPVCILRIGDFYHTKIVIDNLNFTYEPLVWDLNPEGVGVQPMIATVDMQFSFIGGSSMRGPINRLQNAVSFNFFANTEVYDPRADTIMVSQSTSGSSGTIVNGIDPNESGKAGASTNQGGNTNQDDPSQAATAAATTSSFVGPPPPPPSTNADIDRLALVSASWSGVVGTLWLRVTVARVNGDDGSPLSKDYEFQVRNESSSGSQSVVTYGNVTYLSGDTNKVYVFTVGDEIVPTSINITDYPSGRDITKLKLVGTNDKLVINNTFPPEYNSLGFTPLP